MTNSLLPSFCLRLRQSPNGPVIAYLLPDDPLTVLYGYRILNGLVWIEVVDAEGRLGWVPLACTFTITLTPTMTPSPTVESTATPQATNLAVTPTP